MNSKITKNIIDVLVRLDNEAKNFEPLDVEYIRRGCAIKCILEKVSEDFGEDYMIKIFTKTCKRLGHTLSPLHSQTIQKLMSKGFTVGKIHHAVSLK